MRERLEAWLATQNFTMFNRRQTAKKGFEAGWEARGEEVRAAERATFRANQRDRIRKAHREITESFRAFVAAAEDCADNLSNFQEFAAGWRCRKNATYQIGEDFSPAWLAQRSRLFRAGWHSRRIAEIDCAMESRHRTIYGSCWASARRLEVMKLAMLHTVPRFEPLPGQNWFRDSSGRLWVHEPYAAMMAGFVTRDEMMRGYGGRPRPATDAEAREYWRDVWGFGEPFLDAGVPNG